MRYTVNLNLTKANRKTPAGALRPVSPSGIRQDSARKASPFLSNTHTRAYME
jgi:hypothetical protein